MRKPIVATATVVHLRGFRARLQLEELDTRDVPAVVYDWKVTATDSRTGALISGFRAQIIDPATSATYNGAFADGTNGQASGTFAAPNDTDAIGSTPAHYTNNWTLLVGTSDGRYFSKGLTVGTDFSHHPYLISANVTLDPLIDASLRPANSDIATTGLAGYPTDGLVAISNDAGSETRVIVQDTNTGTIVFQVTPFKGFTGGASVAKADVDGDGVLDVIVGAKAGGGPRVKVYSGATGQVLTDFMAFDQAFTGGVNVAAADFDGDGRADIAIAAASNGGPHVIVLKGGTYNEIASLFVYSPQYTGGINLAAGDLDGDGKADLIVSTVGGGGPHVRGLKLDGTELASFYAFGAGFTGGVNIAAADLNGDGKAEIIAGAGPSGGPDVRVFSGNGILLNNFFAFSADFTGGVRVGTTKMGAQTYITVVPASKGGPNLRLVDPFSKATIYSAFVPEANGYQDGLFVN